MKDKLKELADKECWSLFEGCCCGKGKNHTGDHKCAAKACDCTWTTEQANRWWDENSLKGFPK